VIKMKVIIVCTGYNKLSQFKDPGQIAHSLAKKGFEVECFISDADLMNEPNPDVKFVLLTPEAKKRNFWDAHQADVFLFYFLAPGQLKWLTYVSRVNPGAKLILKCDSDGLIPLGKRTSFLRQAYIAKIPYFIGNDKIFRRPLLKVPLRICIKIFPHIFWFLNKVKLSKYLSKFDLIMIESPEAGRNLILNYPQIKDRVVILPNGVTNRKQVFHPKENRVISAALWTNACAKRPLLTMRVLKEFIEHNPNWKAVMVGPLSRKLQNRYQKIKKNAATSERFELLDFLPNEELRNLLGKSKIFFCASRTESFSIVSAEALSSGCSLVCTPFPSAYFLTAGGLSGTLSENFSKNSLLRALEFEVRKWESGFYDALNLTQFWQEVFDWDNIVSLLINLTKKHR